MAKSEKQVLTPGGMKPESAVHHVAPGEAVTGEGKIVKNEKEPDGMRPSESGAENDTPAAQADSGGSANVANGEEPAGMRPGSFQQADTAAAATPLQIIANTPAEDLVLTPGGYRHKSL